MSDGNLEGPAARRGTTINLRVETETRDIIDAAASVLGKTRTEFVIDTVRCHAIDVLLDQRLFVLDDARHAAFVAALDSPPAAGPKVTALLRRVPVWDR